MQKVIIGDIEDRSKCLVATIPMENNVMALEIHADHTYIAFALSVDGMIALRNMLNRAIKTGKTYQQQLSGMLHE